MIALKYTPATTVAILFSFEAVFGALFELMFGHAQITTHLIIGFILIFIAEIISEIGIKKLFNNFKNIRKRESLCDKSEQK